MLSDLTQEEFEYCAAALAYAQALGLEKPPGKISIQALAEWFDLTTIYDGAEARCVAKPKTCPSDIALTEQSSLLKCQHLMQQYEL